MTSKDIELIALGELLVDLLPVDGKESSELAAQSQTARAQNPAGVLPDFRPLPGGAPANVAVGVAQLGASVLFAGQVGTDFWGDFLVTQLQHYGVDTSALRRSPTAPTPLAFVHLSPDGERSFSFRRIQSADLQYAHRMLPSEIQHCRIFHFGALSLTHEPVRSATLTAARSARDSGALISFDPNDRPALWELAGHSREQVRLEMLDALRLADVVKVSEEELLFLSELPEQPGSATSLKDIARAAHQLLSLGPSLICVTRGEQGVLAVSHHAEWEVPSPRVQVVDTTGAGDGFVAGLLAALLREFKSAPNLRQAVLRALEEDGSKQEGLRVCLEQACAVGALATCAKGAMAALPDRKALDAFLSARRQS